MRRLLPLILLAACVASPTPSGPPAHDYVFVFLRRGAAAAGLSDEQRQRIQADHLANIGRLAQAGQIVVAGPFGEDNPEPDLRGLFIFNVPSVAQAEELTRTDPAVQGGVLELEAHPLVSTADLPSLLARDLAARQKRLEAGDNSMGAGMRNYVVAIAEDAERAGPLLDADPHTRIAGRFGGDWAARGLWVLDFEELAQAQALVLAFDEEAGPIQLYPWYGSEGIATLRVQ